MEDTPIPEQPPIPPPNQPPEDPFWGGTNPANPAPSAGSGTPKKGLRTWLAAGAGAAVLLVGGIVGINAASSNASTTNGTQAAVQGQAPGGAGQGGMQGGMGTAGTIKAIDGSSFTLTTSQSSENVTVKTSSETTVTSSSTGTIDDIETGDNLTVMGSTSDTDITAERVIDSGDTAMTMGGGPGGGGAPPGAAEPGGSSSQSGQAPPGGMGGGPGGGMAPVSGTVTKVSGSTITLKGSDGTTYSVATEDATISIQEELEVSDLKTGDTVMVSGSTNGTTVTATGIRVGDIEQGPGGMGGGPGGMGGAPGQGTPSSGAGSGGSSTNSTSSGTVTHT